MMGVSYELVVRNYWCVLFIIAFHMSIGLALKRMLNRRHAPSLEYVKARLYVQQWLEAKGKKSGKTRMDQILCMLSEYICKVLENEDDQNEKEAEIKKTIAALKDKSRNKELMNALLFEVTVRIQPNNVDPIQLRRAGIIQRIIRETFEKEQDKTKDQKCCQCPRLKNRLKVVSAMFRKMVGKIVSILRCFGPKFWLIPLIPLICRIVFFYGYDYFTDIEILLLYSCQFISFLYPNGSICGLFYDQANYTYLLPEDWYSLTLNDTLTTEDSLMVLRGKINLNFLASAVAIGAILFCSFFGILFSIRSVRYLCSYKLFMQDPENERQNAIFPHEEAVHRLDLAIQESTMEASLQFSIQSSTYLANAWLLTWMQKKLTQSPDPQDPLQFSDLWQSVGMSVLSQTLGRYKRRALLHEESDGSKKKALFFIYSLLQTVFVSLLLVNFTTGFYDIMTMIQLDPQGRLGVVGMVLGYFIFYIIMLMIVFIITSVLRLPTHPDILTTHSAAYQVRAVLQCWVIAASLFFIAWLSNFDHQAMHKLARVESMFTGQNITSDSALSLYEATPNNNRKIFALISMILINVSWVGAELCLWLYLQTSSLHMQFTQEERRFPSNRILRVFSWFKYRLIESVKDLVPKVQSGGFWLDLNTDPKSDPEEIEKFVEQFSQTEKVVVEVKLENETDTVGKEEAPHGDLDTSTKEDGTESDNEVKANEIEMNNLALMAEDLDQENTKKEEREGGDEDAQNVPEIAEEDEFSKLKKIKLSFEYWRFQ